MLAQFDLFVVNVAAPSMLSSLETTTSTVQLAIGGYSLTYGTLLVVGGRLGDVFGPRRVIRVGMVSFAIASIACALAQSGPQLVTARLLQGACSAIMVPQVLALVTRLFPPSKRGAATAWFGVTLGVGAVLGQALGGYLVERAPWDLSWRSIFLVVVLPAFIGAYLVGRLIPTEQTRAGRERPHLDVAGLVGLAASLMFILVPVTLGPEHHWPWWTWVLIVIGALGVLITGWWEMRRSRNGHAAVIDTTLFRQAVFRVGLGINAAYFMAFGGVLFVMTFTLQEGLNQSPEQSGLTFVPQGAAFAVASLIGSRLAHRLGARLITVGALASSSACALLLVQTGTGAIAAGPGHLWPTMALLGIGNGLAIPAMIASVLEIVASATSGTAAGLLTTTQQVAMAFGVAVLGSIQSVAILNSDGKRPGYLNGLSATLTTATALLALAGFASTLLYRRTRRDQTPS